MIKSNNIHGDRYSWDLLPPCTISPLGNSFKKNQLYFENRGRNNNMNERLNSLKDESVRLLKEERLNLINDENVFKVKDENLLLKTKRDSGLEFPFEMRVLNIGECEKCIYKCEGPAKLRGLTCVLALVPRINDREKLKTWLETFGSVESLFKIRYSLEKREKRYNSKTDTTNDDKVSLTDNDNDDCDDDEIKNSNWKPVEESESILSCTLDEQSLKFGPNNLIKTGGFGVHKDWKLGKKQDHLVEYRFRFSTMCDQMFCFSSPFQIKSKRRKLALSAKELEWTGKQNHLIKLSHAIDKLNEKLEIANIGEFRDIILMHDLPTFKKTCIVDDIVDSKPILIKKEKRSREEEKEEQQQQQQQDMEMIHNHSSKKQCRCDCAHMIEKQNERILALEATLKQLVQTK